MELNVLGQSDDQTATGCRVCDFPESDTFIGYFIGCDGLSGKIIPDNGTIDDFIAID